MCDCTFGIVLLRFGTNMVSFVLHSGETEQNKAEIYEVISKTAAFVAKAGPSLESKIKEKNFGNPKFGFLNPWNEFHAYYRSQVDYFTSHGSADNSMQSPPTRQ